MLATWLGAALVVGGAFTLVLLLGMVAALVATLNSRRRSERARKDNDLR